jgi:hypothetical protein
MTTRWTRAVAALFFAFSAFGSTAAGQADNRPTVAVMYFNNGALGPSNADYEPLRKGIADILITEMKYNQGIRLVERDQLQKVLEEIGLAKEKRVDEASAVRVGKLLSAQHMIFGGFVIDMKGTMRLDARAVNVESSAIEYVETVTDKSVELLSMISSLAEKMNKGMKLPSMAARTRPASATPSTDSDKKNRFQAMMLYSRALVEEDNRNTAQAVSLYKQFLDTCPKNDCADQRQVAMRKVKQLEGSGNY